MTDAARVAATETEHRVAGGLHRELAVLAIVILLAAAVRLGSVLTAPAHPADLAQIRAAVVQWLASLSSASSNSNSLPSEFAGSVSASSLDRRLVELGVSRIEIQLYDQDAVVLIRAGVDGQPGVAGVDDNGDGIVDNRAELGATRSDDICVVAAADQDFAEEPALILERGAMVPDVRPQRIESNDRRRANVIGQTGQDRWSFVVVP